MPFWSPGRHIPTQKIPKCPPPPGGFGQLFIFSARHQLDTWTLAPRRHVVWRDSVGVRSSRSGLKSECADIFSSEPDLWLLRHTDEPQRGRNSCLWLQSRSGLSSFGVVLMSCRVNFHVVRSALQYSVLCRNFISIYKINRTLHGRLVIRILSSRARSISHEWAKSSISNQFIFINITCLTL